MPVGAAVDPEKILRDLRDLWEQLGRDQEASGGVLRACAMTLITAAESPNDTESVRYTVGMLMHDHPSRAIILCPQDGAELSARIFSECWMPLGGQQQICAEGIEITADPVQASEVARLLIPLIVQDLPVVLWCRGARAFRDRTLDPLFPLAGKIVFDTSLARHAPSAMEFLRRLRREGRRVSDLAWTRLTGFREAVAHLFDDGVRADGVKSARVLHGGAKPDSGALYLSRWIERSLGGIDVVVEGVPDAEPGLRGVVFSGPAITISLRRLDASSLEVQCGDKTYRSPLPATSDDAVLREEMSIIEVDPVFERALG